MATDPPPRTGPDPVIHTEPLGAHGEFRAAGPTHDLGYEPDKFSVKTILAVPVAVLVTGVIAFGVTWLLFANIFDPRINNPPVEIPVAAERNAAPLNERLARISSTDPNAEVMQPRLEGLQQTEIYEREGHPITSWITTTQPTKEGNPPRYHAEELRPGKVVDEAIARLVNNNLLPVRKDAPSLDVDLFRDRPKESNGGNARYPETVTPPPPPPVKKDKEDEGKGKEPEKKDDEGKGGVPEKK